MKKLWFSVITAACLMAGTAANAGDHWRGNHDHGRHRGWEHRDDRRCDDDRRRPHARYREVREVYYRPREVYYRPVYYSPAPVYYEGRHRRYDNDIHGSITVGF